MNENWQGEWSDSSDDFSDFDESFADDSQTDLIKCAQCGEYFYDEAICCPVCGTYVTDDTTIWSGRSRWWIVLGVLGIIAVTLALALGI